MAIKKRVSDRRFVDGWKLLFELEDRLTSRIAGDSELSHLDAGRINDHVSDVVEAIRTHFGIGNWPT